MKNTARTRLFCFSIRFFSRIHLTDEMSTFSEQKDVLKYVFEPNCTTYTLSVSQTLICLWWAANSIINSIIRSVIILS